MGIQDGSADDSAVPVSYLPGYVFLSYVISVMGCATTLELLHRRTAMAGLYNWYVHSITRLRLSSDSSSGIS